MDIIPGALLVSAQSTFGEGNQYFTTVAEKKILSSTIESGGGGYTNNPIKPSSSGVSTSKNQINFVNHGFSSGEVVSIAMKERQSADYHLIKIYRNS